MKSILVIKKDCSVFPLSSLWLPFGLVLTCQLSQASEPWSREPIGRGKWSSGQCWAHHQAGGWQLWTQSFHRFPEMCAVLQESGIPSHGQGLRCLRTVNENFARGWKRPNLGAFLTLSPWDPLIVPRRPLGK